MSPYKCGGPQALFLLDKSALVTPELRLFHGLLSPICHSRHSAVLDQGCFVAPSELS